ncbi:MAG: hypothetical protein COT85_04025 [Chlamydiae bacterium CG10_big_fil_rev_8_21_14_0_10_42_34]|nr:MAG: hypothetical protein COT85_04025 [Chlamydiae bacterium CG10_big_fil_rev_8_21_14_0_10_42_34]
MPGKIPPQSPEFCWAASEASYEKSLTQSNDYLTQRFPNAKVLAEDSIRGWRFILIENNGQLTVATRGTDKLHNWIWNIWHELVGNFFDTTQKIERLYNNWEQEFNGKITLQTAHSGGAKLCAHVRKDDQEFSSVFFNAHKSENNPNHIYLATSGDILTLAALVMSDDLESKIKNYKIVGPGGHSLDDFEIYVKGKKWADLDETSKEFLSDELKGLRGSQLSSKAFLEKLESLGVTFDEKTMGIFRENLSARDELFNTALSSKNCINMIENVSKEIASTIYNHLAQKQRDIEGFWDSEKAGKYLESQGQKFAEDIQQHSRTRSSEALSRHIGQNFHPQNALLISDQIKKLSYEFDRQLEMITSSLNRANKAEVDIQAQFGRLNQLDQEQQKAYKNLLEIQKKIAKKYRTLDSITSAISIIASVTERVHPLVGVAATAVKMAAQFSKLKKQGALSKSLHKAQANLELNLGSKQRLAKLALQNQSRRDQAVQQLFHATEFAIANQPNIDPGTYKKDLESLRSEFEAEFQAQNELVQKIQREIDDKDNEIKANQDSITSLNQSLTGKQSSLSIQIKNKEIAAISSRIISLEVEKKSFEDNLSTQLITADEVKKNLDKVIQEEKRTLKYKELRTRLWEVISTEDHWICANTEEAREVREEIINNSRVYNQARAEARQIAHGILGSTYEIATVMGWGTEGIQALSRIYTACDQYRQFRDVIYPAFQKRLIELQKDSVEKKLPQPGFSDVLLENKGIALLEIVVPTLQGLSTAMYLITSLKSWANNSRYKSVYEVMLDNINRSLLYLKDDLNRSLNSMENRILNKSDKVLNEIRLLREILDIHSKEIISEIRDFREESNAHSTISSVRNFLNVINSTKKSLAKDSRVIIREVDYLRKKHSEGHNAKLFSQFVETRLTIFTQELEEKLLSLSGEENNAYGNVLFNPFRQFEHGASFPAYTTSLLALELNTREVTPNWVLLEEFTELFIKIAHRIDGNENLKNELWANEKVKKAFADLCSKLLFSQERLIGLSQQIPRLIQKIRDYQNDLLRSNLPQTGEPLNSLPAFISQAQKRAVEEFNWEGLLKGLVGDKKFALHNSFFGDFEAQTIAPLCSAVETEYYRYRAPPILAAKAAVGLIPSFIWSYSNKNIPKDWFENDWKFYWSKLEKGNALSLTTEAFVKDQSTFSKILNLPVDGSYNRIEYQLFFNLAQRKIIWLKKHENQTQQPSERLLLASITVNNYLLTHYSHSTEEIFNRNVLSAIQATGGRRKSVYNNNLKNLISKYYSHLKKITEGNPINPIDDLPDLAFGEIVLGLNADSIPLIFPRKLLDHLENSLNPAFRSLKLMKKGTFFPQYQFSMETGELIIHYRFCPEQDGEKVQKFARFIVAQFDSLTIKSFSPTLPQENSGFDPSEFLIQAMYGNFANLGLPGRGSLDLPKYQQIAPREHEFMGLYNFWEAHPSRYFEYRSEQFHSEMISSNLTPNTLLFQQSENFIDIAETAQKERKLLVGKETEYERLYNILTTLTALFSGLDQKFIGKILREDFDILPPDMLDSLFDLDSLKEISEERVQSFLADLLQTPSRHVRRLASLQSQTYDVMDWLTDKSVELQRNNENSAITFFEQADRDFDEQLAMFEPFLAKPTIDELGIGKFNHGDSAYTIFFTPPDGACALHALVGEINDKGICSAQNARTQYVELFRKEYEKHKAEIKIQLSKLLKDYLANKKEIALRMIFASMEKEEICALSLALEQEPSQEVRESLYLSFFDSEAVREKYLRACSGNYHFFSDCEIAIAAHLFGKRAHIFSRQLDKDIFAPLSYGPLNAEDVYILHENNHYSHCRISSENSAINE